MTRPDAGIRITRLTHGDLPAYESLMSLFGDAFDEAETYTAARPAKEYVRQLLDDEKFILLAAVLGDTIVGGAAAYELKKFEQQRSEIYIYDLAVSASYRRRGIATGLIDEIRRIGTSRNAWVVFVQADQGDEAPIALYSKLGRPESVLHFDIDVAEHES